MLTLALDTANRRGGFALARDGVILASCSVDAPDGFAGIVYSEIESLLADHGYRIPDIDIWAPASGPGSFTGVRIGLTVAKALAEVTGRPAVPISNLEALAFAGSGDLRAAVMDARRGQVFTALFDAAVSPILEPSVETWPEFLIRLEDRQPQLIAPEESVFGYDGPASLINLESALIIGTLADSIALLAEQHALRGETTTPEQLEPVYVRRPDVREPQ